MATLFPEGLFTGLIGRLFRIPVLIMFHGLELNPTAGSRKTRLVKKWSVGLATAFATNSQATADRAVRGYGIPADRIKVIHLGQLNRAYRPAVGDPTRADIGLEDDDLVVLGLGRLVGHKGFADLIKAIARTRFQIKLVIVGDGPDRAELVRLTGELGLDRRVTFMGRVDRVEPYYALADMFALASFEDPDSGNVEGFGIVMVEAQAAGLPVIGTDSGGRPRGVRPGPDRLAGPSPEPGRPGRGDHPPGRRPGPASPDGGGRTGVGQGTISMGRPDRRLRRLVPAPDRTGKGRVRCRLNR